MKKLLLLLLCVPMIGFGQNVNIPDANFKAYLVWNTAINTNGDSEIQQSEAAAFNGSISCSNLSISDLTGIEEFTALTELGCYNNQLTILDVSNNTALTQLICDYNHLTCLDVSQNTALTELNCSENLLEKLNTKNGNWVNGMNIVADTNNLTCVEVDNIGYANSNWSGSFDSFVTFSTNCNYTNPCNSSTVIQEHTTNKELLKVTDILGRETPYRKNTPLFYIYDDGTVEKKLIIKN